MIPVPGINRAVVQAVNFGRTISEDVLVVHVTDDLEAAEAVRARFERQMPGVSVVIVESPFRSLIRPFVTYLDVTSVDPEMITIVVLPEYVARHWWDRLLYNQVTSGLKRALLGRPEHGRHDGALPARVRCARPAAGARRSDAAPDDHLSEAFEGRASAVVSFRPMSSAQVTPRRVVLGLNGGPTDALVVRIACELVRQTKGTLAGVHIVEVDWSHDLSEDIASDNEAAAAVLDLAETHGRQDRLPAGDDAPPGARRRRCPGRRGGRHGRRPDRRRPALPQEVRRRLRHRTDRPLRPAERAL